jgi:hypothetical protein
MIKAIATHAKWTSNGSLAGRSGARPVPALAHWALNGWAHLQTRTGVERVGSPLGRDRAVAGSGANLVHGRSEQSGAGGTLDTTSPASSVSKRMC